MKGIIVVAVAALALTSTASAAWKPGTAYFVSEDDASSYLESYADYAYCNGIPRFGHTGEFPYEEFRVFDCTIKRDKLYCTDWRMRAVKGRSPGTFRIKSVRIDPHDCY